ncbi:MAG: hypothetical protein AB7Q42_03245 [Acidimicrobiia bacterium]
MKRHPVLTVVAVVAAVLGVVGFLVVRSFLAGGGETSEIPLDEIIRRYEASTSVPTSTSASSLTATSEPTTTTATTAAANIAPLSAASSTLVSPPDDTVAALPAPGVYVYATSGGDSIDAVGGVQHDYPATTTITVTPADCGVLQRWDVVAERWEEWRRCAVEGGVAEPGRATYDEFFDIGQTDRYECTGDARPLDAAPGTTWVRTCRQGDEDDVHTGTVVGVEQVDVGGTPVPALHVRTTIDNGVESDRQITESWYQLGSDLLLARSASNRTTNETAFGVVHYVEEYEIRLTALDPLG